MLRFCNREVVSSEDSSTMMVDREGNESGDEGEEKGGEGEDQESGVRDKETEKNKVSQKI